MDGRRTAALLLLVGAVSCGGCTAPHRQRVAQEIIDAASSPSPIDRPSLREIFRDGRFVFRRDAELERAAEAAQRRDPVMDDAIEKLVVRLTLDTRGDLRPMYAIAAVKSDLAVQEPDGWEGVLRGFVKAGDVNLHRTTLAGTEVAYGEIEGHPMLMIDYAPDLVLSVTGPNSRSDVEILARYLLRARS